MTIMAQESENSVSHPKHYNASPATCECGRSIECIQVVRHMNFNLGNVVKYLWRAGLKKGSSKSEDLMKAKWYLEDEIKKVEGKE